MLRLIFILGFALSLSLQARQPNVLLIMTDDQGWGDVRAHGNEFIDTPVLDGLSERSVRFDRFFVSPVCAPTRSALLTGRYPARAGVTGVTQRREVMRAEETTIAEVFRAGGYATGIFGKWHNGEQYPNHPLGQGFEEFYGFCGGHWNIYFDAQLEHQGKPVKSKGYITDVITDAALKFIDSNKGNPFFCYVPYNAPHSPWSVDEALFQKCLKRVGKDKRTTACAYAMVENLDTNIGRLLARLKKLELESDTIVVFLTDNGPNGKRYNGGMRGAKGSVHEGGVRVPCFVSWPGSLKPRDVPQNAAHIDLLPTLASLCGIKLQPAKDRPLDGLDISALLRGEAKEWPDRHLITWRAAKITARGIWPRRGAVRSQRYRFVREKKDQLYDLKADPGQKLDISKTKLGILKSMQTIFEAFDSEATASAKGKVPVPVGFAQAPWVELPGVECVRGGGVSFRNVNGWAHDWLVNWKSKADRIGWNLEVQQAGRYGVYLSYACAPKNIGSKLRISAGRKYFEFKMERAFDKGETVRPELSDAKGLRKVREFGLMKAGEIALPKGRVLLELQALSIPGDSVCELDALRLKRID